MIIDLGLLIGLISIALALFFGIFFGLAGFRKSVTSELSTIKETVIAIQATAEKTWDLILRQFAPSSGTVVRQLGNLWKVKISAEPGAKETIYLIEIEKPVLKDEYIVKIGKETKIAHEEMRLFGKESYVIALSPTRMRWSLPGTGSKTCTEFITFMLKWLNSTYVESLKQITEFEEPILT